MSGNVTRRGAHSWRLKFEAGERDPATGKRRTRYLTVKGTKKDAQRELTLRLAEVERGTAVDPSRTTVGEYLRDWLGLSGAVDPSNKGLSPKTLERYRQLAERQIIPHLGGTPLQKLRAAQIHAWHATLLRTSGRNGKSLATRTVCHAHRVLHRALARAVSLEIVGRNVAHAVPPPKAEAAEIAILSAAEIGSVLTNLDGHPLNPIAAFALSTGMRRGEICALAWGAVDLNAATVRVERSMEETANGLRLKPPKTRHGRRTISLPATVVETLRTHRRGQAEQRLQLGLGRPGADDYVFALADGSPYAPDKLSRDWGNVVRDRKLPRVMFHALRHSHASALIAAGLDVVTVSRRLGHGSPAITLTVYAHQFVSKDIAAADAIEAAISPGAKSPA
jgi:integrase